MMGQGPGPESQPGDEVQTERPRFDPFTGKPLRYDPVTGQPLSPPPSSSRRKVWIGLALVTAAAALALVLFLTVGHGGATAHDLRITLDVATQNDGLPTRTPCEVADTGYDDLTAGAPVTVKDSRGVVLAASSLPAGKTQTGFTGGPVCHFALSVQVPDSAFYQVEVSHRGTVTFTRQDLQSTHWTAGLTIGG
jgi:hypothetical protein